MSSHTLTIALTSEELRVVRGYCWLRTLKLVEQEIEELPLTEYTDRQQIIMDDLEACKNIMESIRTKLVDAMFQKELDTMRKEHKK